MEFIEAMEDLGKALESRGHEVTIPSTETRFEGETVVIGDVLDEPDAHETAAGRNLKEQVMKAHYQHIEAADAVVVVNKTKHGVDGYVGANTFLEIGVAHYLEKPIFLTDPIPQTQFEDELTAIDPHVLDSIGDLER